ncbi:MAG TPA: hypothetical protein VK154_00780 [Chitinophagales bacterium]|nr:hypothetical protein [Chitinophagales bacterium]
MKPTTPALLLFLILSVTSTAQQKTAASPLSGYQQTIKLNSTAKIADVFSTAENWIYTHPTLFTTKNAEPTVEAKQKNKQEVDDAYGNSRPLQSIDPVANRLTGLGLIKYFGGTRTCIRMLYLKYDITIEVKQGLATFKLSNLRYFHFDPKTYKEANVFSFNGGTPCDNTGTIEYLKSCQVAPEEMNALGNFFRQTADGLYNAFKKELGNKKMLPAPTAKPATAKKPAAKTKPTVMKAGVK